jgi:hypothetical protein
MRALGRADPLRGGSSGFYLEALPKASDSNPKLIINQFLMRTLRGAVPPARWFSVIYSRGSRQSERFESEANDSPSKFIETYSVVRALISRLYFRVPAVVKARSVMLSLLKFYFLYFTM